MGTWEKREPVGLEGEAVVTEEMLTAMGREAFRFLMLRRNWLIVNGIVLAAGVGLFIYWIVAGASLLHPFFPLFLGLLLWGVLTPLMTWRSTRSVATKGLRAQLPPGTVFATVINEREIVLRLGEAPPQSMAWAKAREVSLGEAALLLRYTGISVSVVPRAAINPEAIGIVESKVGR